MLSYQLIDRLLRCERRIFRIYQALSERADFPADMRAFWRDMAEDEHQHREFLEHTSGLLNFMTAPPEIPETVFADVEAKIVEAETAVQQASLSADEALRLTLRLEGSELCSLDETWCQSFQPSLESLLHIRLPDEEAHIRRLVDAVQKFSTDEALHQQATALWATYQQQSDCIT